MVRNVVKTSKFRVGKNTIIVIKIFQTAISKVESGNALASNAANVRIFKNHKKK